MRKFSDEVIIMTDDGSYGNKGLVTDGVEMVIKRQKVDLCVTIGPAIMMKFVSELTKRYDIPTIASLIRFLNLDDHVNGYIADAVDFILEKHGLDQLNIMAICQGGTMSVMYAALHPEKVKNLVLTVTPTNFDHDAGLLNVWARSLDPDKLVASYGNIPGDIMNLGFLLLNPARLMIDKYVGFLENIHNRDFVENFVRMERWIFDSPDLPGEAFRDFIQWMFRENRLIKNELVLGGKKVDLKNITMPVLNIYGKYDHLVPPAACDQLTSKIGSTDKEDLCLDTGHIGIYVSSKTQREFGPKIIRWLTERDDSPEAVNTEPKKVSKKKKAGATAEED